jgi:predicted nucleic acid-binding protein
MRRVTLDASVVCKWFLQDAPGEADIEAALALLAEVEAGRLFLVQPPHWMVEVVGVLARIRPANMLAVINRLHELPVEVRADRALYARACALVSATGVHLNDALYHAIPLTEAEGELITADQRYYLAAARYERVRLLGTDTSAVHEPAPSYLIPRRSRRVGRSQKAARRA